MSSQPRLAVSRPAAVSKARPLQVMTFGCESVADLVSHLQLRIPRVLLVSAVASLVGLVGAKLYQAAGHYIIGERGARALLSGTCIQGFVLGSVVALVVGTRLAQLPPVVAAGRDGARADVRNGGRPLRLLLRRMLRGQAHGVTMGSVVLRPPGGRSSDPNAAAGSTLALLVGIAALLAHLFAAPRPAGVVFVGSIAAY